MELVLITGISGAGKSTAIQIFEDMGYYCVDNLPPALLDKFIELTKKNKDKYRKVAFGIDVRGGVFFQDLESCLDTLKGQGVDIQIVFLEAQDEVVIDRFKATRRRHPMENFVSIVDAINGERKKLENIRGRADRIIDTSELPPRVLKNFIQDTWGSEMYSGFSTSVITFGFKYGLPIDCDLVIDVRFLRNPYYQLELRPLTGRDQKVKDFVFDSDDTREFLKKYEDLIEFLLPRYKKEGKSHLVIGVGCTGGRHRSVAIGEYLADKIRDFGYKIELRDRDIDK